VTGAPTQAELDAARLVLDRMGVTAEDLLNSAAEHLIAACPVRTSNASNAGRTGTTGPPRARPSGNRRPRGSSDGSAVLSLLRPGWLMWSRRAVVVVAVPAVRADLDHLTERGRVDHLSRSDVQAHLCG
jgi:hypothetical protein